MDLEVIKKGAQIIAAGTKQRIEGDISLKADIKKLVDFLPACEYELILYMIEKNSWTGPVPLEPTGFKKGEGAIELGLFLYWFNNPDQLDFSKFNLHEIEWIFVIIIAVDYLLPATKLTTINYDFFNNNELIYVDGTVLSIETYANFDQGWFTAFLNLFKTLIDNLWYHGGTFPPITPPNIPLKGANADTITIAILGDWGAGNDAAKAVMNQIVGLKPDYIVHVGDVYYGGTPALTSPNGDKYLAPGEEYQNLLDLWPAAYKGKSFTLNSNHEMYSGANGLFYDALGSANSPFGAQKGTSCFALQFGGWTVLGLDTAFRSSILSAFMTGSIGAPNEFQSKWIQGLNLNPNKTIVFSHHNGFEDDCCSVSPLWAEINGALKGDPFAWYWGHVHNGIVYDKPITIPTTKTAPGITTNTFARCLGHAALPYGPASSLEGKPITYKADSPRPSPSKELYNGFAILTLTSKNGALNTIIENFYDTSNRTQPRYSKSLL